MKRISALAIFEWKKAFRKPSSYFIMFGMPLLFTFIFGAMIGGESEESSNEIAVVDEDSTPFSEAYAEGIRSSNILSTAEMPFQEAEQKLEEGEISGYIQMKEKFGERLLEGGSPEVVFEHAPSLEEASLLSDFFRDSLQQMERRAEVSKRYQEITGESAVDLFQQIQGEQERPEVSVMNTITGEEEKEMDNLTARSTGFTIMFVMISMLGSTGVILEAKQRGTWYRLMSTPAHKWEILMGYMLAFFLIGWVQFGVLMVATNLIFGVTWGSVGGTIMLVSVLLLATIGLGLLISGYVRTSEQQSIYGNLVIISTCMLGGVYWPVEIMPDVMQQIGDFVPQTWALEGFRELTVREGSLADIWMPIVVLLAFAAIFLLIGIKRIRFE